MDRINPIPPGPKATIDDVMRLRQIEAIRLSLRLFDRQLEASAKASANGTPQQLAFDNACRKFLDSLSSVRFGERYQEIQDRVAESFGPSEPQAVAAPRQDRNRRSATTRRAPQRVKPSDTTQTIGENDSEVSSTLTPYDRAQLLVDQEAVTARSQYEADRSVLLEKLKKIRDGELSAEEKPEVLEKLNLVEREYSRIWKRLESGARGAEILKEVEKSSRRSNSARKKSSSSGKQKRFPKTRIKRNSTLDQFTQAIRELDREAARQERIASERRELQTMVQSHPYRNNSVSHDRIYLTSGFRNPRAKK